MTAPSEGTAVRVTNARLMDTTDELPAEVGSELVLGRYRLGPRLGAGGFGTVFAATDERLRRPVAVKVIPAAGRGDPTRAQREALAAGRLDHPGIVAIFDAGQDSRARYLVSELVQGPTLDELSAEGVLSDRDVVRIGLALCDALEHAHGRGVVHRDVKPQNVIIPDAPRSAAGVAKLADFGVAHLAGDEPLTRTGDVVGTLAYMAPEQAAGRRVDERADLYSLALVLYEALAGTNPVRAGSPAATARRVGTVLPPLKRSRKDLPPSLNAAIDRALRPRPEERGTLDELAAELAEALPGGLRRRRDGRAAPARAHRAAPAPARGGPRRRRRARRRPARGGPGVDRAAGGRRARGGARRRGAAARRLARHRGGRDRPVRDRAARCGGRGRGGGRSRSRCCCTAAARRGRSPRSRPRSGSRRSPAPTRRWRAAPAAGSPAPRSARSAPGGCCSTTCATKASGLKAVATSGELLYAAVWAVAALILPWLVRGRWLAADVVAASIWAAALGAGTAAAAEAIGLPEPSGLVLATFVAGLLAVAIPHLRRVGVLEP